MKSDIIEYYVEQGFNLIPITKTKKPRVKWKRYQTEEVTPDQVETWMKKYPNGNWALICGKVSGGLVVLDFDDPHLVDKFFSDTKTLTARTQSGGIHKYFISKKIPPKEQKHRGFAFDIQGEGSYVVAPPSVGENGVWEFTNEEEILVVDDILEYVDARLPNLQRDRKAEIERMKKELDITEVIQSYGINAETEGHGYWQAFCPFHPDRKGGSPSFTVYDDHFYCYSCGERGDVISFVERQENCGFNEAVRILSEKFGVKPPKGGFDVGKEYDPTQAKMTEEGGIYAVKNMDTFRKLLKRFPDTKITRMACGDELAYSIEDGDFLKEAVDLSVVERVRMNGTAVIVSEPEMLLPFIGEVEKRSGKNDTIYIITVRGEPLEFDSSELVDLPSWREKLAARCQIIIIFNLRSKAHMAGFATILANVMDKAVEVWRDAESEEDMYASTIMEDVSKLIMVDSKEAFLSNPAAALLEGGSLMVKTSTMLNILNRKNIPYTLSKIRRILNPYLTKSTGQRMFLHKRVSVWFFAPFEERETEDEN